MKVKRLIIKNIGKIADTTIDLNQALIIFYGGICQGKTTILNAVKWCFGGSYPDDIIRHGQFEASVTLEFEGASIQREWYKGKDGSTINRPIVFIRDGKPVKKPVDEIKKFLNPFLLDQDYLRKMTEPERKVYFAQLFGVDTTEIDKEYSQIEVEARDLRSIIKGYGVIDLKEVKSINPDPLRAELSSIRMTYSATVDQTIKKNREIIEFNNKVSEAIDDIQLWNDQIETLENQLKELKVKRDELHQWVMENPHRKEISIPEAPDTSDIEVQIAEAAANEVRVEQYKENLKRGEKLQNLHVKLSELEAQERSLKREKISKLTKINASCPIKNLSFDEMGNFKYEDTTPGMLSGSQVMKLSSELSSLYPEGLGIDLIDRAESLGKSIFGFVDRAEKEKKTILAAIVGEKPAVVPEHIGVYVVEDGEVK